jgi:AcrR family transcriptional regulator
MDDIVVESGLSKGTLYWYFKSKQELFVSMLRQVLEPFGQALASIAAREGKAADKLRDCLALFRTEMDEVGPYFGVAMEAWALTRHDDRVKDTIREVYSPYADLLTRIIQEGVSNGEFEVGSSEAMALMLLALFDGIALYMSADLWERDWNEVVDQVERLILRGLGVEGMGGGK